MASLGYAFFQLDRSHRWPPNLRSNYGYCMTRRATACAHVWIKCVADKTFTDGHSGHPLQQVPIIMLSSDSAPSTVSLALQRGAVTFVSKAETASAMVTMIERVLRQEPGKHRPPGAMDQAAGRPRLTPRQCEVLELLCQGLPDKSIGKRLGLAENTVRGHVQALLALLQVSSRTEASFAARRSGLTN